MKKRNGLLFGAALAALVMFPASAAGAASWGHGHPWMHPGGGQNPNGAVVSLENGPYGNVLVVGGAGAGYVPATSTTAASYDYPAGTSLYFASVDPLTNGAGPYQPGCTTTVVTVSFPQPGPLSCAGSETDPNADWPAFTTSGPPIAGPGVEPWLLGTVYRTDLGTWQVTYAGRPLYLFDPGPNSFQGANFFESVAPLPPWHTAWYLLSPNGQPAAGAANLEVAQPQAGTVYQTPVLGAEMLPGAVAGGANVAVYTFSGDRPWSSRCNDACAREFIPVYTSAPPTSQAGVNARGVGVIVRCDGSHQVTYYGWPLYIYSQEQPLVGSAGLVTTGSAGNGNGITAFGGTFKLVTP